MDVGAIYTETRERVAELVLEAADRADEMVPACPAWSVKDVVAHVTGLVADWRNGNLNDYAADEWTAAQVDRRRDVGIEEILAEWADHSAAVATMMSDPEASGIPHFMPMVVITDLVAHEHDIRHALSEPGARSSAGVIAGLRSQIGGLRQHFAGLGLATLEVEAVGLRSWMIGLDERVATLRAEPFELFRATGGRRTMDQVGALDWSGDAATFIPDLLQRPFAWPDTALIE